MQVLLFTAPALCRACLGLLEGKHRAQLIELITGCLVSLAASFGVLLWPSMAWHPSGSAAPWLALWWHSCKSLGATQASRADGPFLPPTL